jgi:hypothetical protein
MGSLKRPDQAWDFCSRGFVLMGVFYALEAQGRALGAEFLGSAIP